MVEKLLWKMLLDVAIKNLRNLVAVWQRAAQLTASVQYICLTSVFGMSWTPKLKINVRACGLQHLDESSFG